MNLLMLPRYGRLGASSRLRSLQYIPYFVSQKIDVTVKPLFSDKYVANLYAKKNNLIQAVKAFLGRVFIGLKFSKYDVLLVEKELFPWLPAFFELLFISKKTKLVLDFDDAIFHRYDEHKSFLIRYFLGKKIDVLMRRANLVTVGNEYLAGRAIKAGCKWVEIIPTVIDLERYPITENKSIPNQVTIGWIGSPSTANYLTAVSNSCMDLREHYNVRFIAVGANPEQLVGTPFESLLWTEDTEVDSINSFDVGIMPLPDAPWERGKCAYKLIQYMACGLPVIASPVGVNSLIVENGVTGFLCQEKSEWLQAMKTLVQDSTLSQSMGNKGRLLVEKQYSLQVQAPRLTALLFKLSGEL